MPIDRSQLGPGSRIEPRDGLHPDTIALEVSVIEIDGERFCFSAAVEPNTNQFRHFGLYPHRIIVVTKLFLRELQEKNTIEDAEFFVDGAPWLHA